MWVGYKKSVLRLGVFLTLKSACLPTNWLLQFVAGHLGWVDTGQACVTCDVSLNKL